MHRKYNYHRHHPRANSTTETQAELVRLRDEYDILSKRLGVQISDMIEKEKKPIKATLVQINVADIVQSIILSNKNPTINDLLKYIETYEPVLKEIINYDDKDNFGKYNEDDDPLPF